MVKTSKGNAPYSNMVSRGNGVFWHYPNLSTFIPEVIVKKLKVRLSGWGNRKVSKGKG